MNRYVIIRDMSAGNESVGDMWQETKIFDGSTTLDEVMNWANQKSYQEQYAYSKKRITITKPHEDEGV